MYRSKLALCDFARTLRSDTIIISAGKLTKFPPRRATLAVRQRQVQAPVPRQEAESKTREPCEPEQAAELKQAFSKSKLANIT